MADQVKFTNKLKGAKVLILGGSSGIGYATAEGCLEQGASVIISSSNSTRITNAIKKLQSSYPSASTRVTGHTCDLSSETTVEENLISLLKATGGNLDHIVHCAAEPLRKLPLPELPLPEATFDTIKQLGMIRFFSYILLGKHAGEYMRGGRGCSISFTTAAVSERPMPGWTVLNAFQTSQAGIVRGLALDLKPVRVNLVLPGAVDTEFWGNTTLDEESKKAFFEGAAAKLPTGKVPGPEDVAEAYLYLMKDRNITGTVITTDGGWLLV